MNTSGGELPRNEEVSDVLELANAYAAVRNQEVVAPIGILEAMATLAVKEPWSWGAQLLNHIGAEPGVLLTIIRQHTGESPDDKRLKEKKEAEIPLSSVSQQVLESAEIVAQQSGYKFMTTAHLIEAFCGAAFLCEEAIRKVIWRLEITPGKVKEANERLLGRAPRTVEAPLEPGQKMAAVLKSMLGVEWDVEESGKLRRFFGLALAGLSPEQRALLKDMALQLAVELGKAPEGMAQ